MPEQFNASRPGRYNGIGIIGRVARRFVGTAEVLVPGKMPLPYLYQRGKFDYILPTITVNDAVAVTDAVTRSGVKTLADAVTINDSMVEKDTKTVTDSVGVTDQITKSMTLRFADAVSISDAAQENLKTTMVFADSVGLVDHVDKSASKQVADAVTANDSLGDKLTILVNDSVGLTDHVDKSAVASKTDQVNVADQAAKSGTLRAADNVIVTDAEVNVSHITLTFTDAVFVTDEATTQLIEAPPTPPVTWQPMWARRGSVKKKVSRDQIAVLEKQAEVIIERTELPESYPVGAKKAYEAFQSFYGSEDGRRIFIKKALEQGRGDTVHDKIADVFKTGTKVDQTKKMETRVQVLGKNGPNVSVTPLRGQGVTILRRG